MGETLLQQTTVHLQLVQQTSNHKQLGSPFTFGEKEGKTTHRGPAIGEARRSSDERAWRISGGETDAAAAADRAPVPPGVRRSADEGKEQKEEEEEEEEAARSECARSAADAAQEARASPIDARAAPRRCRTPPPPPPPPPRFRVHFDGQSVNEDAAVQSLTLLSQLRRRRPRLAASSSADCPARNYAIQANILQRRRRRRPRQLRIKGRVTQRHQGRRQAEARQELLLRPTDG